MWVMARVFNSKRFWVAFIVNVSLNLFDDKISYGDGFSYYKELSSFQAAQAGLSSL